MKKLISLLLALIISASMMLSAVLPVSAAETTVFTDVKSSHWFYNSVNYVVEKGIMEGVEATRFAPNTTLSRAMAVTLLYRMASASSASAVTLPFKDVKSGKWYTDAVKWAYSTGIIKGKSKTYFGVDEKITRAEFAVILYRYAEYEKITLPVFRNVYFKDRESVPMWARDAVDCMCMAQIINGKKALIFFPFDKVTRAESAEMIYHFIETPKNIDYSSGIKEPVNSEVIPTTGQLVIKEKTYDYNGGNVTILNIANQTKYDLTLTVKVKYLDSKGKCLSSEERIVEGFPANYRNYVVFEPNMKYAKLTYELKSERYNKEAYMKYMAFGSNVQVTPEAQLLDILLCNDPILTTVITSYNMTNSHPSKDLTVYADWVVFDKYGEILWIENYHGAHSFRRNTTRKKDRIWVIDTLWDDYKTPERIKGKCTGIVAFRSVTPDYPKY